MAFRSWSRSWRSSFVNCLSTIYAKYWVQWHPAKSLIASTTTHGNILIWHCPQAERWGAFAGGFEEADENIEYEEKEDEFDIVRGSSYYTFIFVPIEI